MKNLYFFILALLCLNFSQGQPRQSFPKPDIRLLPQQVNNQTLMRVNMPDTVYSIDLPGVSGTLINYQPAIAWDTSMQPLRLAYKNTSHFEQTAFVVYQCLDSINEYGIWQLDRDSIWHNSQTTRRFIKSNGATEYESGNSSMPLINTSVQAWTKSRIPNKEHAFILGQCPADDSTMIPFSGLLGECLIYGKNPDARQRAVIQSYLALKYGITLIEGNYVDCSDSILWDCKKDSIYCSGIAGLGKDSLSGLDQKQSHSTSEPLFLSIAAGQVYNTNQENTSTLQQGDYLLWGHDAAQLQVEGSQNNAYAYTHPLLQRKWLIKPYGNMRHTATEVVIRTNELADISGPFWLVIDRSGAGNFASVFTGYIPADSISLDGEVFFKNIYWDTDSSGGDLFTFAVGSALLCNTQNPTCGNNSDGKLDIEITGGVSPYRYRLTHTVSNQRQQWQSAQRVQQVENLAVGKYTLEAYDSQNNHWKKENISLTSSLPESFSLSGTYHIALGDTLFLDVQSPEADSLYSYIWKKDGIVLSTASYVQLTQAGHYEVSVSNAHGCTTVEDIQVITEESELFPCQIYPNPTTGACQISVSLPEVMEVQVRVFTLSGILLANYRGSGQQQYHFNGYLNNTGRYLVDVQTPMGRRQLVMIVKR